MSSIEERLSLLERSNRRWKCAAGVSTVVFAMLVLIAWLPQDNGQQAVDLRARSVTIVDQDGTTLAWLGPAVATDGQGAKRNVGAMALYDRGVAVDEGQPTGVKLQAHSSMSAGLTLSGVKPGEAPLGVSVREPQFGFALGRFGPTFRMTGAMPERRPGTEIERLPISGIYLGASSDQPELQVFEKGNRRIVLGIDRKTGRGHYSLLNGEPEVFTWCIDK
jgi:hypothetical protein